MNKIGVVIPACNEEAYIERCLLVLKKHNLNFINTLVHLEIFPRLRF